jgi:tetratricopeptide (TPR) repeat protein
MSSANDSSAPPPPDTTPSITAATPAATDSTAIQAGPPADGESIPLPAPPPPAPPRPVTREELAAETARLDRVLVVITLALAFLVTSFTVRNPDFWTHLAAGRLLAQEQYTFGVDPFSYASGPYWVNHAWLFDGLLYGLSALAGGVETPAAGALLVGFKAALLTALAAILLLIRRPGQSLWAPAVCTALAVVALSPRALMQPTVVSFFFLGLTLYLLQRPRQFRERRGQTVAPLTSYWLLPPLFALWANLDNWFLLGPAAVALYLLGEVLQKNLAPIRTGPDAPEPTEARTLLVVLGVGLAACLLNPHGYRVFTLPIELYSPTLNAIHGHDPQLYNFPSPLNRVYYSRPGLGLNPTGLAFYPLLLLGVLSFALTYGSWRLSRLTLWLGFALLGLYSARNIPFFAVVAAPLTALNLQDYAARRFAAAATVDRATRQWALGGRLLTLLAGVALLILAWPGWLHASPDDPRLHKHVAWAVEVDPSLRQAAAQLKDWRARGLIGDQENGFNYNAEVASYFAWFCPEEKGFFDTRFPLFTASAPAWVDARKALLGNFGRAPGDKAPALSDSVWQRLFRDERYRINHLVLTGNDGDTLPVIIRCLAERDQWSLLYADGRTCIYGWNDPARKSAVPSVRVPPINPAALAFGKEPVRAPAEGLEPPGRPQSWWDVVKREWWDKYNKGPAPQPLAVDEAVFYINYYLQAKDRWQIPTWVTAHFALWTGARAAAWTSLDSVTAPAVVARLTEFRPYSPPLAGQGLGPPAPLYVAVRAARQAVRASPEHAPTYLLQARAYATLSQGVERQWTGNPSGRIAALRQLQQITALERLLTLRPNQEAHALLSDLYENIGFLDAALAHANEALKLKRDAGKPPGQPQTEFTKEVEQIQEYIKRLDTNVQKRLNDYLVNSDDPQVRDRLALKVELAVQRGLARKALELLRQPHSSDRQSQALEASRQVELLLFTGQVEELREGLTADLKPLLGENYEWYNALLALALGNYRRAGEYLEEMIALRSKRATAMALMLTQAQTFKGDLNPSRLSELPGVAQLAADVSSLRAFRGVVALEEGDLATATQYFQKALELVPSDGVGTRFDFDGRAVAQRYLALLKDQGW